MTVLEIILLTASYYSKPINEPLLEMYAEDLADLPASEVIAAYKTYRRSPKNRTFPLPAQIREIVEGPKDPEGEAAATVGRIIDAVTRFGYSNSLRAMEYIGASGWQTVKSSGGWDFICANLGASLDLTTFSAQLRNRLKQEISSNAHKDLNLKVIGSGRGAQALETTSQQQITKPTLVQPQELVQEFKSLTPEQRKLNTKRGGSNECNKVILF